MKIGIITFFAANNYGAILQAYALQRKVEEMYGFSECIDYKCPAIEKDDDDVGRFKEKYYQKIDGFRYIYIFIYDF